MAAQKDALVHGLCALISTLEEQGLLNSNFASAYQMKPHDSSYFLDLVLMFCNDVEAVLRELVLALELPVVDYEYMFQRYLRIKESTTRFGACALGLAIDDLSDALDTTSREGCYMALLHIRHEYHVLRPHLGTVIELERRIIHLEGNQPGPGNN